MKKIMAAIFFMIAMTTPLSNVFASDYTNGLFDDTDNISDTNMGRLIDNDLTTGYNVYRESWYLEFVNPVNIASYYRKGNGVNTDWTLTLADGESVNLGSTYVGNTGYNNLTTVYEGVVRIEFSHTDSTYNATQEFEVFSDAPDRTPPGDITSLQLKEKNQAIDLSWQNPTDDDFSHVNIYQDGELIENDYPWQSYTTENLVNDQEYTFEIRTVDLAGNESSGKTITGTPFEIVDTDGDGIPDHEDDYPNDPLNGQPDSDGDGIPDSEDDYPDDPENIPPPETADELPEVENLQIEATPERVDLSWNNPPRHFEKAKIYRKSKGETTSFNINPFAPLTVHASETYEPLFETNGTEFADLSVDEQEQYEYKVTNFYDGMESDGVTVQTTIPKPPLIDTSNFKLPFGVQELIQSSNGLLYLIGSFVLLGLSFIFVPKLIRLIVQSVKTKNETNEKTAHQEKVGSRDERYQSRAIKQVERAQKLGREKRQSNFEPRISRREGRT